MSKGNLRSARPCAICQKTQVIEAPVCTECMEKWGDQQEEDWFKFCIEESKKTANLVRITRRKERDLSLADMV